MKCPHCQTGIHSGYTSAPVFSVESLKGADGSVIAPMIFGYPSYLRCPECFGLIVVLQITTGLGGDPTQKIEKLMVYPKSISRPVPPEVPDPYRQDFVEAAEALSYSEKASGALSRRCLQSILRDKAGVTHSNLHNEINEVMASGKLPSDIADGLHVLREFGNFAAHPLKDAATGMIVDVEPGEAEWMLDIIERLFDLYFVGPALTARRTSELNAKLAAVGKKPLP